MQWQLVDAVPDGRSSDGWLKQWQMAAAVADSLMQGQAVDAVGDGLMQWQTVDAVADG